MHIQKFKFIKDNFRKNRGDYSKFFNIYCENCGNHVLLYQKDGPGPLKRLYLDRILAPESLADLQSKNELQNLTCRFCNRLLAIPDIYQKENRKAYALLAYVTIKKQGRGEYPPATTKIQY